MNSSVKFALGVAVLLAASLGWKVSLGVIPTTAEPDMATAALGEFLKAHAEPPVTPVQQRPGIPYWAGWRFSAGGCGATAFPVPRNGEMDAQARAHAGPGDTVAYIYRGQVRRRPPSAASLDFALFRALWPLHLADPQWGYYVILLYPTPCPTPLRLPWGEV